MAESIFANCSDGCGWGAAVICVLSFGSFGVPIKLAGSVDVDPFILQSYKTIVCFATSFLVVLMGEELRWSSWGLASGLFWVPGASCGIFAIRNCGMATAVGTWSACMVVTSFLFGIVLFQEKVKNLFDATCAFLVLICGLVGMARYSSVSEDAETSTTQAIPIKGRVSTNKRTKGRATGDDSETKTALATKHVNKVNAATAASPASGGMTPMEIEPLLDESEQGASLASLSNHTDFLQEDDAGAKSTAIKDRIIFFGGRMALTRRQLGIIGAMINGCWGGLNLIPLHFARRDHGLSGAGFLPSFATGSLVVQVVMWMILIAYHYYQKGGRWEETKEALPEWHLQQLWKVGLAAGLLYSLGNFTAMLAVTYLGQGVGFSFCQLQLLVSGLWGVFFFKEITGGEHIFKWFISAAVAVVGIIGLSYQHEGSSAGHRYL